MNLEITLSYLLFIDSHYKTFKYVMTYETITEEETPLNILQLNRYL